MELKDYRQELDGSTGELVRLFCRRMEIAGEIGDYKGDPRLPILDAARGEEKPRAWNSLPAGPPGRAGGFSRGSSLPLSREAQQRARRSSAAAFGKKAGPQLFAPDPRPARLLLL